MWSIPEALGELELGLEFGEYRAGFFGGGSSSVSTGDSEGRCFFIWTLPLEAEFRGEGDLAGWGLAGTILRVAGSYVPGAKPPEEPCAGFGEGGSGCFGFSRGFALNVRVAGSNTMIESGASYDVPSFPG